MGDDLAASNVNRSYSLAATSTAIFTFLLFFLYPRFASGEIDALLFQATLVLMGVATFSFVFASFYYYCSSLGSRWFALWLVYLVFLIHHFPRVQAARKSYRGGEVPSD